MSEKRKMDQPQDTKERQSPSGQDGRGRSSAFTTTATPATRTTADSAIRHPGTWLMTYCGRSPIVHRERKRQQHLVDVVGECVRRHGEPLRRGWDEVQRRVGLKVLGQEHERQQEQARTKQAWRCSCGRSCQGESDSRGTPCPERRWRRVSRAWLGRSTRRAAAACPSGTTTRAPAIRTSPPARPSARRSTRPSRPAADGARRTGPQMSATVRLPAAPLVAASRSHARGRAASAPRRTPARRSPDEPRD